MAAFKNPFFSIAGQKERLSNVVNYGASALGLQKTLGTAKFDSKGASIFEKAATSPAFVYGAPAVIAAGITAYPAIAGAATGHTAIAGTAATATGFTFTKAAAIGATGLGAGLLLGNKGSGGAGGASTPQATIDTTQQPKQDISALMQPIKNTYSYQITDTSYSAGRDIYGAGVSPLLSAYVPDTQNVTPSQDTGSYPELDQTSTGGTGGASSTNWLLIAAIAFGAYFLFKD